MPETRGAVLLIFLLLVLLLLQFGRAALVSTGPPAFFRESGGTYLGLGKGFPHPGIHQFSDDIALLDVIKLAAPVSAPVLAGDSRLHMPLSSGESLEIVVKDGQPVEIRRTWLPAGQRVALGIPLHPDRMSQEDWRILPGVGIRLAETIERDRQLNGDFFSVEELRRVRGIGSRRLESWKEFFPSR